MLDLLIKKNEYNQAIILGATLLNTYQSIEELTKQLEFSKSSLFRYLTVINDELKKIHPVAPSISSDGVFLHLNNPGDISKNNLFVKHLKIYLQNSTQFRLLSVLSKFHQFSTSYLLETLHVSHSYFNKLLKEINTYIKPSHVRITQRNNRTYLAGPEVNLIVFKLLLKNISLNLEDENDANWTSDIISQTTLFQPHLLTNLTLLQQKSLSYLEQIVTERLTAGRHISISDEEVKLSLTVLKEQHNLLTLTNLECSEDMLLFINLLTRFTLPSIDDETTRILIAKDFLKHPTSLTRDTDILLRSLTNTYDINLIPNSPRYYEYFYQGMIAFLYLRLLNYNFNTLFTLKSNKIDGFYIYNQADYAKIKDVTTLPIPFTNTQNDTVFRKNSDLFTSSLFTAIRKEKKAQLTIYLDFHSQLSFESYLKKRINSTFNPDCLHYCHTLEEADVIVTDSLVETPPDKPAFIFLDTNSSFSMGQLLILLMELYTKKLISSD